MGAYFRILIVNTRFFFGGGDSTYAFNLAELLQERGHQVAFFAMQDERNIPDSNDDLFVSPIDFKELNQNKSLKTGFKVIKRAIYSTEAQKKFGLLIDRFKPDLIHLQNIHGHITPSVIFEAKKRGLPVIWTLHDYKLICPNTHYMIDATGKICEACRSSKYYQPILKRCKKGSLLASGIASIEAYAHKFMGVREKVDGFLTPSEFLRKKLICNGFSSEKVYHLPLFLPNRLLEDHFTESRGYFLYFGKIEPIKGVRILVEAARLVPDAKVVLAGRIGGELIDEFPGIFPENVTYVGMKYGKELWQLLEQAMCVVLPSLWYENQPFSILEAFAKGKPVIASQLGGMKELIADQKRGILVPPGDVKRLAEAMKWMIQHPEDATRLGENARNYVKIRHSPERHYDYLLFLYNKFLSK